MSNLNRAFVHSFEIELGNRQQSVKKTIDVVTSVGDLPKLPEKITEIFSSEEIDAALKKPHDDNGTVFNLVLRAIGKQINDRLRTSKYYRTVACTEWNELLRNYILNSQLFVVDAEHPRPEVRMLLGSGLSTTLLKLTTVAVRPFNSFKKPEKAETRLDALLTRLDNICREEVERATRLVSNKLNELEPVEISAHQLLVVPTDTGYNVYRPVVPGCYINNNPTESILGVGGSFAIELLVSAEPVWAPILNQPNVVFGFRPYASIPMDEFELVVTVSKE